MLMADVDFPRPPLVIGKNEDASHLPFPPYNKPDEIAVAGKDFVDVYYSVYGSLAGIGSEPSRGLGEVLALPIIRKAKFTVG